MGLRLRKSIRILPGLKINLSKTGASVSVGKRGMSYNIGKRGIRTTVGLPGSGVSYSTYSPNDTKPVKSTKLTSFLWLCFVLAVIIITAIYNG